MALEVDLLPFWLLEAFVVGELNIGRNLLFSIGKNVSALSEW